MGLVPVRGTPDPLRLTSKRRNPMSTESQDCQQCDLLEMSVDTMKQRIQQLEDELSRVTAERDKAAQNNQRNAKLLAMTLIERDAARRRVRELECLATGNECTADGGTWVEVFISNDRLNPEKGVATLGLAFPARLDAEVNNESWPPDKV